MADGRLEIQHITPEEKDICVLGPGADVVAMINLAQYITNGIHPKYKAITHRVSVGVVGVLSPMKPTCEVKLSKEIGQIMKSHRLLLVYLSREYYKHPVCLQISRLLTGYRGFRDIPEDKLVGLNEDEILGEICPFIQNRTTRWIEDERVIPIMVNDPQTLTHECVLRMYGVVPWKLYKIANLDLDPKTSLWKGTQGDVEESLKSVIEKFLRKGLIRLKMVRFI